MGYAEFEQVTEQLYKIEREVEKFVHLLLIDLCHLLYTELQSQKYNETGNLHENFISQIPEDTFRLFKAVFSKHWRESKGQKDLDETQFVKCLLIEEYEKSEKNSFIHTTKLHAIAEFFDTYISYWHKNSACLIENITYLLFLKISMRKQGFNIAFISRIKTQELKVLNYIEDMMFLNARRYKVKEHLCKFTETITLHFLK